jgi:hypothetical protein
MFEPSCSGLASLHRDEGIFLVAEINNKKDFLGNSMFG